MKQKIKNTVCHECGMLGGPLEYHPWAVCRLFIADHDSGSVRANIKTVIEYGMKAQRLGVSAEDAMNNLTLVSSVEEKAA